MDSVSRLYKPPFSRDKEKGRGIEWRQIFGKRQEEKARSGPWNGRE